MKELLNRAGHPNISGNLALAENQFVARDARPDRCGIGKVGERQAGTVRMIHSEWRSHGLLGLGVQMAGIQAAEAVAFGSVVDQIAVGRPEGTAFYSIAVGDRNPFGLRPYGTIAKGGPENLPSVHTFINLVQDPMGVLRHGCGHYITISFYDLATFTAGQVEPK